MTDVTTDQDRARLELPAADEQLVRELTERARAGGLKLTGEGGLLGKLTKMVIEGALKASWTTISAMSGMTRKAAMAAIPATGAGPRRCLPIPGRWRFPFRGTGIPASSRKSSPKGSGG